MDKKPSAVATKSCTMHLFKSKTCKTILLNTEKQDTINALAKQMHLFEEYMDGTGPADDSDDENNNVVVPDPSQETEPFITPEFLSKKDSVVFSTNDVCEVELLKMLEDANCPHYLFEEILKWSRKANDLKYGFKAQRNTRKAQIQHYKK